MNEKDQKLLKALAPNFVGVFVLKWDGTYETYTFKDKSWRKFKRLMDQEDQTLNEEAYK